MAKRTCSRGHEFTGEEPCPTCWPGYRTFTFKAKVWLYSAEKAAWHFINVPKKESEKMKERFADNARGWGSLPVTVTVGQTSWDTSIFPDKKRGSYLLPLKANVRKKEEITEDDTIAITIDVRL